jgi:hypothetical protein
VFRGLLLLVVVVVVGFLLLEVQLLGVRAIPILSPCCQALHHQQQDQRRRQWEQQLEEVGWKSHALPLVYTTLG